MGEPAAARVTSQHSCSLTGRHCAELRRKPSGSRCPASRRIVHLGWSTADQENASGMGLRRTCMR